MSRLTTRVASEDPGRRANLTRRVGTGYLRANWAGLRLFQQALSKIGWTRFPMLRRELPEANGGLTDASAAASAPGELAGFRTVGDLRSNPCLVNAATGELIQEHS